MYKVITKSEATIRNIADNKIAINYITKDVSPDASLAITSATELFETETTAYNRIYFVLEGELELSFDNETIKLTVGDSCFISKDTHYKMKGTFKVITVNQPAFGT